MKRCIVFLALFLFGCSPHVDIVHKIINESIIDNSCRVSTQVWCRTTFNFPITLEYWETSVHPCDSLEIKSVAEKRLFEAAIVKKKVEQALERRKP